MSDTKPTTAPLGELRQYLYDLEIEFLHGVPVFLPRKTVDDIIQLFNTALTAERQRLIAALPEKKLDWWHSELPNFIDTRNDIVIYNRAIDAVIALFKDQTKDNQS